MFFKVWSGQYNNPVISHAHRTDFSIKKPPCYKDPSPLVNILNLPSVNVKALFGLSFLYIILCEKLRQRPKEQGHNVRSPGDQSVYCSTGLQCLDLFAVSSLNHVCICIDIDSKEKIVLFFNCTHIHTYGIFGIH